MENEEVVVSDEVFDLTEKEIEELLATITSESESSAERMESIMKRVKVEAVLKESTDFLAEGMSKGLKGIADTLKGITKKDPEPPKRSY
tara:strand:+ start:204 stop:470 length:267 start_codon:yes stop_codon:yes gene_type:complete